MKVKVSVAIDRTINGSVSSSPLTNLTSVYPHGVCAHSVKVVTDYNESLDDLRTQTAKAINEVEKQRHAVCESFSFRCPLPTDLLDWSRAEYADLLERRWVYEPASLKQASLHGYTVIDIDVSGISLAQCLLWWNALNAAGPVILDWVMQSWITGRLRSSSKTGYRASPWLSSLARERSPWGWEWCSDLGVYQKRVSELEAYSSQAHQQARFHRRDPFASSVFHLAQLHDFGLKRVLRFWPLPDLLPAQLPVVVKDILDWLQSCQQVMVTGPHTLPLFKGRVIPDNLSARLYLLHKY